MTFRWWMDGSNGLLGRVRGHSGLQSEGFNRQWDAIWTMTRQLLGVNENQGWEASKLFRRLQKRGFQASRWLV